MAQTYRAALRALMERYEQADVWNRTYIRKQAADAIRLWRDGRRPDGSYSDLVCALWCELPTLKPEAWRIQFTQPMGWCGPREIPAVWIDETPYGSMERASNAAYYACQNERFGSMTYKLIPSRLRAWRTYAGAPALVR